ncbi:hypothetical protein ACWDRB_47245 [Nonomuraea sp. NPDC003707]
MTIVATRPATIATTLSPAAVSRARTLMQDQGWIEAADATGADLLDLIDEALDNGDLSLCERCGADVTTNTVRYEYSGEVIAICDYC